MLSAAWFIARKDVRYMLHQRETLLWTFLMPLVFIYFIGTITGGFGAEDSGRPIALETSRQPGFLADVVAARLGGRGFVVERPTSSTEGKAAEGPPRLALPAGFTDSLLAGRTTKVTLTRASEDGLDARQDEVRVARVLYALLADLALIAGRGEAPNPASLERVTAMPRTLTLAVETAGRRKVAPQGFEQAVPGTMVMFTLLVLFTSGSVLLVIERQAGLLRRLAATPLPRGGIVLGKWGGRMALGTVQIGFALAVGTLLFQVDWGPDLPMLLLVLLAWAALASALGLLLGNVARSEAQAVAIGVLASMLLAALGGCWWPIEVVSPWMQKLALFLPTGWTMDALHELVSFRSGAAAALPHVLGLATAAVAVGWVATRSFRFQ